MSLERETKLALELLRGKPDYVEDARKHAPHGNSIVGSVLNLTHKIPRQYAEAAVVRALELLDAEEGGAS